MNGSRKTNFEGKRENKEKRKGREDHWHGWWIKKIFFSPLLFIISEPIHPSILSFFCFFNSKPRLRNILDALFK